MKYLLLGLLIFLLTSKIISQIAWERVKSLNGGNINSILCKENGDVFIGTEYGGLYKFEQNTKSWILTSDESKQDNITSIGEDFKNNLYIMSWWSSGGLIKSTDEGTTWQTSLNAAAFSFKKDTINNQIIVGSYGRIYKSTDNGLSWIKDSITSNSTYVTSVDVDVQGNIYAGTANGLFKEDKNSLSWSRIDSIFESEYIKGIYSHKGDLFVVDKIENNILYKSTDNGTSWTFAHRFANGLNNVSLEDMDFDNYDNIFIALQNLGIAKSTDGGITFFKVTDFNYYDVNVLRFNQAKNEIFVGTKSGGVFHSVDEGKSWDEINEGIFNLRISSLAVGKNDLIFTGSNKSSFPIKVSDNYGRNWLNTNISSRDWWDLKGLVSDSIGNIYTAIGEELYKYNFDINQFDLLHVFDDIYYLTSDDKSRIFVIGYDKDYLLQNEGNQIIEMYSLPEPYSLLRRYVSDSNDNLILTYQQYNSNQSYCYFSPDTGKTWELLSYLPNTSINGLSIDSADNIYLACLGSNYGLLKSTNFGKDWTKINHGFSISDLKIDASNNIYICTNSSIQKSSNGGLNWYNLLWDHYNSSAILAITKRGNLFASSDYDGLYGYVALSYPVVVNNLICNTIDNLSTISWQTMYDCKNFGFELQRSLDYINWEIRGFAQGNQSDSSINLSYALTDSLSTAGKYFYRLKQISTDNLVSYSDVIETESDIQIYSYQLIQNYPNPFNPKTTIEYEVPEKSFVTIKIYDILGREVQTLVNNEEQVRWRYKVEFDASSLSSGVYFYRIQAGSFTETKKMMVLK